MRAARVFERAVLLAGPRRSPFFGNRLAGSGEGGYWARGFVEEAQEIRRSARDVRSVRSSWRGRPVGHFRI